MRCIVIYDSFFGNTQQIAEAIGDSIKTKYDVRIIKVDNIKADDLDDTELLIAGSPTRAFKATKAVMNFIAGIPAGGLKNVKTASFDTRIDVKETNSGVLNFLVKIFGYAAEPIEVKLKKKGGEPLISPEGFFVKDSKGPLKDGELKRAAEWAKRIIAG